MPFSINITFLWTRWAFSFIQVHEYKTREPPLCYYHWLCGECLTCCSDSCPCCWHWWLPAGNPPPSGPPVPLSVFRSLPPSSFGIPSSASAALQFHSCLLWCRHTRRDEFRIPHAAVSACLLVRACVCVRSQHMLSSVCRGASRACDAVRAGWGHSTSSVNTSPGANAWFSILST